MVLKSASIKEIGNKLIGHVVGGDGNDAWCRRGVRGNQCLVVGINRSNLGGF